MPVNVSHFIEVLAELCEEKNLRVAASESLKGGIITGLSSVLGGLILGPIGLALGGAIGGTVAATTAHGKFKSAAEIIINMSPAQKQRLYNKVERAFRDIGYEDIINLTMLILTTANFKELAIREVTNFLSNEMNLSIRG